MKKSFEDRLAEIATPIEIKAAKALLKAKALLGAWRDAAGTLIGCFQDGGLVRVAVKTGETASGECSQCGGRHRKLCRHAVALVMYGGRFNPAVAAASSGEEAARYYGGLVRKSLAELIERAAPPKAWLEVFAESAFPHVPSKWETASLSVKMYCGDRSYLGNLNNLRKLYFEKSLTVTLKFEQLSLQEQQIVRFLAVFGEADNSKIQLDAENTTEFFHSLIDFPRFYRNGRQLKVRRESAEPVLLVSDGDQPHLSPGVKVAGALLPCASAKVITGRSGCWIGHEGEYFFIPAVCEISWLRNFFRSAELKPPAGKSVDEYLAGFPLPVVRGAKLETETRSGGILLDCEFGNDRLDLAVHYIYGSASGALSAFPPGTGRLVREGTVFWRRDEAMEREFENDLELFGFEGRDGLFRLAGALQAGLFLDRALPEMLRRRPGLSLSGRLAAMLRGADGVPGISLDCHLIARRDDGFAVGYKLESMGTPLDWKVCRAAADSRLPYIIVPGRGIAALSDAAAAFFRAAPGAMRKLDAAARCFEVPDFAAAYYTRIAAAMPGALVPEIAAGPQMRDSGDPGRRFEFKGELRGYQRDGVAFLQRMTDRGLNAVLADEMGLGKTVQLLALLASRMGRDSLPALIVCPASLVTNWEREANRFVPDFKVSAPATGVDREKLWKKPGKCNIVILSYAAARLSSDALRHLRFSFLVLDEAQHIKNPGSCNAKNCKSIDADHRIVLSGTPLENSPDDLWSIMDFLHHGMLGTLAGFRRFYSGIAGDQALQCDLAARTGGFILRRTKSQVAADLPPKSEHIVFCEMEPEQRALYDAMLEQGRRELAALSGDNRRGNATVFTTLLRLRQICCHPALLPDGAGRGVPSAKTELLLELLHEHIDSHHRMLMFSQFTSLLALTIPELERDGIAFEYLDGATRNRQQRVDHFNETPEIPLFLLSLKAGGTGLNLTSADTVIIYDPWWNPAVELQAADRTHRIGQSRPVSTLKLVVRDSIEEKILALQEKKQQIFDAVIDNPAAASSLSIDDLKLLLN
ncbi:MAG: DEAD/DEAH box helicase [Victivallaceae bacterium]|nr:DEAD/DEAH box helicase [Victivallaceae bacterium]